MKTLDVEAVQAFVLAADLNSFTRAAEALDSTQSAVSLKIKRLEGRKTRPEAFGANPTPGSPVRRRQCVPAGRAPSGDRASVGGRRLCDRASPAGRRHQLSHRRR